MSGRRTIPMEEDGRYAGEAGNFTTLDTSETRRGGPIRCKFYLAIEGWIIAILGIHPEARDDDIYDAFGDFGQIKNLHLNLDRRTGAMSGYALLEYEQLDEARSAIRAMNGSSLLGNKLQVDFAFKKPR